MTMKSMHDTMVSADRDLTMTEKKEGRMGKPEMEIITFSQAGDIICTSREENNIPNIPDQNGSED